jgi:mono/diheme cytochrome c family protein
MDNAAGPAPPLYMPAWKHVLSDEDINRIADYLWSKQEKNKDAW